MQNNTIPFTVHDWAIFDFTVDLSLDLGETTVELSLGYSECSGWDVHAAADNFGNDVDTSALAASLGFGSRSELFAALTDDLYFTPSFREAYLFVKKVPA